MEIEESECVKMKHRGAEQLLEKLKGLSEKEIEAYWEQRSREFREWVEELKRRRPLTRQS